MQPSDLFTPVQIADEFVKEVMDSSFISSAQKSEYCSKLAGLGKRPEPPASSAPTQGEISVIDVKTPKVEVLRVRERQATQVSTLLGILTVFMTSAFYVLELIKRR